MTDSSFDESDRLAAAVSRGHCPDCDHRGFRLGPRGGAAQNIECGGCGARFNVVVFGWGVTLAHRIPRGDAAVVGAPELAKLRAIDMNLSEWTCGHVAGAMCQECYRILAARATELQAEVDRLQDELSPLNAAVRDRLKRDS